MKTTDKCVVCGAALTADDMGATKKFINRASTEYMCVPCLAKHFGTSEENLRERIEHFRESGCLLFPKKGEEGI